MEDERKDVEMTNSNPDWPSQKRSKETAVNVKLDEDGFLRTPNGSFWDPNGEYFNRKGFNVFGGFYSEEGEYIPGPNLLEEHTYYFGEKEKYPNVNSDEFDAYEDELKNDKKIENLNKKMINEEAVDEGELSDGWETVEEDEGDE